MVGRKALFYALLVAATIGLSQFLAAWRTWRAAAGLGSALQVIVFGSAVVASMLWLGFLLYEVDRVAGRVRRPIWFYEWAIARRAAGRRPLEPERVPGRVAAAQEQERG